MSVRPKRNSNDKRTIQKDIKKMKEVKDGNLNFIQRRIIVRQHKEKQVVRDGKLPNVKIQIGVNYINKQTNLNVVVKTTNKRYKESTNKEKEEMKE